jgi:YVTN family beta-propeller protein
MGNKKASVVSIFAGLAILVFFTSVVSAQTSLKGVSGTVWVTNRTFNNVVAFDAGTGEVLATIAVGRNPIGIISPQGTGKVYVSNEDDSTVSVVSKDSLEVIRTIPLAAGSRPHHINDSPDGRFVYVAEFGANRAAKIDTETDTVVAELITNPSAAARTHAVWISQNNQTLYAANSMGANEITAVDIASNTILWTLPVGLTPSEVVVTRNEKTAYVSVRGENKLKVIDLERRQIVDEIIVGTMPDTLRLTSNEKQLIVTLRGNPAQISLVNVFQTLSVQLVDIVPGTITGHHWLSQNGRYSFVAVENPGSLAVVDNRTGLVAATYIYPGATPANRPHGVFYEPERLKQ